MSSLDFTTSYEVRLFISSSFTSLSGDNEIRTRDPLLARQVLSQLSYTPKGFGSHLSSRTVSSEVLSAVWVLTIVFGMGTGVTPRRIATKCIVIRFRLITKQ